MLGTKILGLVLMVGEGDHRKEWGGGGRRMKFENVGKQTMNGMDEYNGFQLAEHMFDPKMWSWLFFFCPTL